MGSLFIILNMALNILFYIILAHVIMSWLLNFGVLNIRQPIVAQFWHGLERLLHPIYSRVREVLPPMGGLDLAPLVVIFVIYALQIILARNAAMFY